MSSPQPWATRTMRWTSRSAHCTPCRRAQTAPAPGPIVWSANGRARQDTMTSVPSLSNSIAHKRNVVSAEVECQRLRSRTTLEIWKRSARQTLSCWPLVDRPAPLDPDFRPAAGLLPLLPAPACPLRASWLACVPGSLPLCGVAAFAPPCSWPFSRTRSSFAAMSQHRQLATQLVSLASPGDTVAQGTHSLLVTAPEPTAPALVQSSPRVRSRSRSRSPVPKRAPTRRESILLSEHSSPTGPAVKCCSVAPPVRTLLSHVRSVPPALVPVPQESAESANTARAPSLPTPRGASACLHPPFAQLARQDPPDAAEARRRSHDKHLRRTRK